MKRTVFFCVFFAVAAVFAFFSWRILHNGGASPTLGELRSSIYTDGDGSAVEKIIDEMTIEEKTGQMILGCFYNGVPDAETVSDHALGGVLLFSSAFDGSDPENMSALTEVLHESCSVPPFTAVDEEGGSVVRVSSHPAFRSEPFKSPRRLYAEGGLDLIVSDTHEKNRLLSSLGIDVNMAPVCDMSDDPSDFMYSRSPGGDVKYVSEYTGSVVSACIEDGMGCVLKHFPGYGAAADTHMGLSVDGRSLKEIKSRDLLPFISGIEAGAPAVLISHNIVNAFDDSRPASLSPSVHVALRNDLGFNGVIMTDDLSMGAVSDYFPEEESAVTAVMAGNDMICTGDFSVQHEALTEAVKAGRISESRIDSSVRRILIWKSEMGLLDFFNNPSQ